MGTGTVRVVTCSKHRHTELISESQIPHKKMDASQCVSYALLVLDPLSVPVIRLDPFGNSYCTEYRYMYDPPVSDFTG